MICSSDLIISLSQYNSMCTIIDQCSELYSSVWPAKFKIFSLFLNPEI